MARTAIRAYGVLDGQNTREAPLGTRPLGEHPEVFSTMSILPILTAQRVIRRGGSRKPSSHDPWDVVSQLAKATTALGVLVTTFVRVL